MTEITEEIETIIQEVEPTIENKFNHLQDLTNKDLTKKSFSGLEISDFSFEGSILHMCDFKDTKLINVSFKGCSLSDCDFRNSELIGCDFTDIIGGKFNLKCAGLTECKIKISDIEKSDFRGATFKFIDDSQTYQEDAIRSLTDSTGGDIIKLKTLSIPTDADIPVQIE
jgi:uncharacterized protein YjbI with pentapeptide repeats